ncbi:hypothetical protein GGI12_006015, partial [Dipsacomyces acuminosporus]
LLASQPAAPATSERADIVSRATIDIPIHRSSSAQSQDSQTSSNGVDDSSLVTLDFLLCLESNLAKIEGMAQEYAGSDSSSGKHVQTALREFRPIILPSLVIQQARKRRLVNAYPRCQTPTDL